MASARPDQREVPEVWSDLSCGVRWSDEAIAQTVPGTRRSRDTVALVNLTELQDIIERTYGDRDRDRGVAPTVAWLAEEFGELAQAVRKGTPAQVAHEFSDVLAWVASLANQVGVDLTAVVDRYKDGCPKCSSIPCAC